MSYGFWRNLIIVLLYKVRFLIVNIVVNSVIDIVIFFEFDIFCGVNFLVKKGFEGDII